MPDSYEIELSHRINSCEGFIRDLKSLRPVWVGVNDDDNDTDARIKALIKKYEEDKLDADKELWG